MHRRTTHLRRLRSRTFGLPLSVTVIVLMLVTAAAVRAEVRTATISDPVDSTPTLSGQPNQPDLSSVTVAYDNVAGTVSVTQRFYNSVSALDTSENYAFFGYVDLLPAASEWRVNGTVEEESCNYGDGFSGRISDYSASGAGYSNSWSVSGYAGELPFETTIEDGGRQVSARASSPALAGHDWRCFKFVLMGNSRRSYLNPYSFYDGGCDCWAVTAPMDTAGTTERTILAPAVWFPGFPTSRPKPESAEERRQREMGERQAREAREREMTLTSKEAEKYMGEALARRYGRKYTKAYPSFLSCGSSASKGRASCEIYFSGGPMIMVSQRHEAVDFDYRWTFDGTGYVRLKRRGSAVSWYYAWKLKRIDWKCARNRPRRGCTKPLIVKEALGVRNSQ